MNEHHLVGAGLYLFSFFMPKDKYFQYTSQGTLSIGPKAHTQCQDKVLISRTFPMKKSISESTQNFCKGRVQKPESRVSSVRGGGYPPFPLIFFRYFFRPLWGGGYPPFPLIFCLLVFRKNPSAMGEGGGTPHFR